MSIYVPSHLGHEERLLSQVLASNTYLAIYILRKKLLDMQLTTCIISGICLGMRHLGLCVITAVCLTTLLGDE